MLGFHRRLAALFVAATLLAPLAAIASLGLPPAALAADGGGLGLTTAARYVLVPDSRVVRVTVDVTLSDRTPDTTRDGIVTRYFYDRVLLPVQDESSHVTASDDGRRLGVSKVEKTGFDELTIRLARKLYYRQTQTFRLTYDLPGGQPRSHSDIRVGRAFATFYAWALGDRATVRIEIPAGFEVDTYGDTVSTTKADGRTILSATVAQTDRWYVGVYADDKANLRDRRLDLPGQEAVVVRSWPEDAAWGEHVSGLLTKALPELETLLGLPWPVFGDLHVSEVHTPLLEGYAGIYDVQTDDIVVTEDLDDLVIVHEASHAWFNDGLFQERWTNEGLADLYASLTLAKVGRTAEHAPATTRTDKAAFPLADWPPPQAIHDEATNDREDYGYGAAWQVLELLHQDVGDDGLRRVIQAADAETIAYVGAPPPEAMAGPVDWHRFLDLLEEVGGSTTASDLFATWVVQPAELPGLRARTDARTTYHQLVAHGAGWLPPIAIRRPMADWDWAIARDRMAAAGQVLAARDRLAQEAAAAGLTPPTGLEAAYEGATTSFKEATTLAAAQLDALHAVVAAAGVVDAPRDPFTRWGLDGVAPPETALAAAQAAWSAGDLAGATGQASAAQAILARAPETGRTKAVTIGAAATAGGVLILGLGGVAFARRRRRPRAAMTAGATSGHPSIADRDAATRAVAEPATSPGDPSDDSPEDSSGESPGGPWIGP